MFDCSAFGFDLLNRDHVKPFKSLLSFRFRLSSTRRILPNLVDDQIKHVYERFKFRRDHVKLRPKLPCTDGIHVRLPLKLPCTDAITSDFGRSFLA